MKLAFIRLGMFFKRDVCTVQQIVDNISCTLEEVLDVDNIKCDTTCIEYKEGSIETDMVMAKINGAGKIQYWKGILSNV